MKKLFLLAVVFLTGCANLDDPEVRERMIYAGAAMMKASGPSRMPVSTGQVIAAGLNPNSTVTDYEWDWDGFYNEYSQLVWACRGVQTGQFAFEERCAFKVKTDYRWPTK